MFIVFTVCNITCFMLRVIKCKPLHRSEALPRPRGAHAIKIQDGRHAFRQKILSVRSPKYASTAHTPLHGDIFVSLYFFNFTGFILESRCLCFWEDEIPWEWVSLSGSTGGPFFIISYSSIRCILCVSD